MPMHELASYEKRYLIRKNRLDSKEQLPYEQLWLLNIYNYVQYQYH
jgi:heterodisulfide reductase subunit C